MRAVLFLTLILLCAAPAAAQPDPTPQTPPAGTQQTGAQQTGALQQDTPTHEWLPSKPFTFFHGRLVVSGDATITYGTHDKGYFDTQDYYHDAFSVMRLGVSAAFRVNDHVSLLGQVTDDVALRGDRLVNVDRQVLRIYGLFARV